MTDNTCYNIEGITVCVPDDTQKYVNYVLVGFAVLIGIAALWFATIDNASMIGAEITGTELIDESIYYIGF